VSRIKRIIQALANSTFLLVFRVLRKFSTNDSLLDKIFSRIILDGQLRVSYSLSSQSNFKALIDHKFSLLDYSDLIILIQGPIDDLVGIVNKIAQYQLTYKNVKLVLSSWTSGSTKRDKETKEFILSSCGSPDDVHILFGDKPKNSGIANINFQIRSTQNGLALADSLGRGHILKCRTDQILTHHNAISYLRELASKYGVNQDGEERIVCLSKNSFLFRPYSISDMVQYGSLSALNRFWNVPMDTRVPSDPISHGAFSAVDWSRHRLAEVYLTSNYFEGFGEELDFTLKQHLEFLQKYFVIGDSEACGLIWPKYTSNSLNWSKGYFPHTTYEISHQDWLNLPLLLNSVEVFSEFTQKKWGG
jgi:hypothetical protein